MLKVVVRPHRAKLHAHHAEPQKVFVMLKVIPSPEVATTRPPLAMALVIDTSTSMRLFADQDAASRAAWKQQLVNSISMDGGLFKPIDSELPTLLDHAMQAAHSFIDDPRLLLSDQCSIIHFNDKAATLLPLSPLSDKAPAHAAVALLKSFTGGTRIDRGLELALDEMKKAAAETARRVFVLTDGATQQEKHCRALLPAFRDINTPLIGIGFGEEYNDTLLADMADATGGRPYHLKQMSDLASEVLEREVGMSAREVVTDLQLHLKTPRGVRLGKVSRVHPSLNEIESTFESARLGNIAAGDFTVFLLEFVVETERAPSRVRLAQLKLEGSTPLGRRDLPPVDVVVEFSTDSDAPIDPEVIGYVQQKNVGQIVDNSVRTASVDVQNARAQLQDAALMTRSLGNHALSSMITEAVGEIEQTGKISPQTARTVALGTRTRTVKTSAVGSESTSATSGLSPEEIRRLSGT
jgi:Ca-activated chloride channel family protein